MKTLTTRDHVCVPWGNAEVITRNTTPWRLGTGWFGGASRDRTDDLLLAKQAHSQLSYGPVR